VKCVFSVSLAVGAVACAAPVPRVDVASQRLFAEAIPICALLANPNPFVGKSVNVSGYYFPTPHGGVFHDAGCERGEMPLARDRYEADDKRARAILDAAWRTDGRADVPVVMTGTLKDHYVGDIPGFMCSGGGICQRYSLESDSLMAARAPIRQQK
jgi:hypothetical protein